MNTSIWEKAVRRDLTYAKIQKQSCSGSSAIENYLISCRQDPASAQVEIYEAQDTSSDHAEKTYAHRNQNKTRLDVS